MSDLNKADPKTAVRPDDNTHVVVPQEAIALPKIKQHAVPEVVQDKSSGAPTTNNPGSAGPFSKE